MHTYITIIIREKEVINLKIGIVRGFKGGKLGGARGQQVKDKV